MKWVLNCQACGDQILTVDVDDERTIVRITGICPDCKTVNDYSKPKHKVDELVKVDPKQKRLA